jgi:hypothetical protein
MGKESLGKMRLWRAAVLSTWLFNLMSSVTERGQESRESVIGELPAFGTTMPFG